MLKRKNENEAVSKALGFSLPSRESHTSKSYFSSEQVLSNPHCLKPFLSTMQITGPCVETVFPMDSLEIFLNSNKQKHSYR